MQYSPLQPLYNLGKGLRRYLTPYESNKTDSAVLPDSVRESVEGKPVSENYFKNPTTQLSSKDRMLKMVPEIKDGDNYFAPESLFRTATGPVRLS